MERTISHRSIIVKQWLEGKEYTDISRNTFHSVHSVRNYIYKFKRVVPLSEENHDIHTIAFLVKISAPLVEEYFNIYKDFKSAAHRKKELLTVILKTTTE